MNLEGFKDWKTTVPAVITAFLAFVLFSGQQLDWPKWVQMLAAFGASGGLIIFGINSKSVDKK
jgi:hypothetical protein